MANENQRETFKKSIKKIMFALLTFLLVCGTGIFVWIRYSKEGGKGDDLGLESELALGLEKKDEPGIKGEVAARPLQSIQPKVYGEDYVNELFDEDKEAFKKFLRMMGSNDFRTKATEEVGKILKEESSFTNTSDEFITEIIKSNIDIVGFLLGATVKGDLNIRSQKFRECPHLQHCFPVTKLAVDCGQETTLLKATHKVIKDYGLYEGIKDIIGFTSEVYRGEILKGDRKNGALIWSYTKSDQENERIIRVMECLKEFGCKEEYANVFHDVVSCEYKKGQQAMNLNYDNKEFLDRANKLAPIL